MIIQNTLPKLSTNTSHLNTDPASNTGSNSQTKLLSSVGDEVQKGLNVHIDWISGTIRYTTPDRRDAFLEFIEGFIGQNLFREVGKPWVCGITFSNSATSVGGIRCGWNEPDGDSDQLGHLIVSIPGAVLSRMEGRDVWRMLSGMTNVWGFAATRIDIALDDYSKTASCDQVRSAAESGFGIGFKTGNTVKNFGNEGFTVYMGSPQSDKRMVYYNKEVESEGELNCYRWELRLKDDLAKSAVRGYTSIQPEAFEALSAKYLAGCVVGAIDFCDRSAAPKEKNLSRLPRLSWWQILVDQVGVEIKHSRARVVKSLDKTLTWVHRQVAKSLYVARQVLTPKRFYSWLADELTYAGENLSAWHEHLIAQYRDEEYG
ncbi:replication initiation factor domain-containing protein [Microcoleus sp. herbarium7]